MVREDREEKGKKGQSNDGRGKEKGENLLHHSFGGKDALPMSSHTHTSE